MKAFELALILLRHPTHDVALAPWGGDNRWPITHARLSKRDEMCDSSLLGDEFVFLEANVERSDCRTCYTPQRVHFSLKDLHLNGTRQVAFGIRHGPDEDGYDHGPFMNVIEALETIPSDEGSVIVRFEADHSNIILFIWNSNLNCWEPV